MTTYEWLQAHLDTLPGEQGLMDDLIKPVARRILLMDGESVSVQANLFAYCVPRSNKGPYLKVEVGMPSCMPTAALWHYAEQPYSPKATVYGYVPIEIVVDFLDVHGGPDIEAMEAIAIATQK